MGIRVCSFKIGVTTNPIVRFPHYQSKAYTSMWVLWMSDSKDLIHMLEAALVFALPCSCRGAKTKVAREGEGNLNCKKKSSSSPPYFLYVTGGRADQSRRVGWKVFAGIGQAQEKKNTSRVLHFWPTQLEYCSHDNTWPFTTLTPSSQFLYINPLSTFPLRPSCRGRMQPCGRASSSWSGCHPRCRCQASEFCKH